MNDELVTKARQLRLVMGNLLNTADEEHAPEHEAAYELAWEVEKLAADAVAVGGKER